MVNIPYVEKHKTEPSYFEPFIYRFAEALDTDSDLLMGSAQGDLNIFFLHMHIVWTVHRCFSGRRKWSFISNGQKKHNMEKSH